MSLHSRRDASMRWKQFWLIDRWLLLCIVKLDLWHWVLRFLWQSLVTQFAVLTHDRHAELLLIRVHINFGNGCLWPYLLCIYSHRLVWDYWRLLLWWLSFYLCQLFFSSENPLRFRYQFDIICDRLHRNLVGQLSGLVAFLSVWLCN
jgi:hypothetical protein